MKFGHRTMQLSVLAGSLFLAGTATAQDSNAPNLQMPNAQSTYNFVSGGIADHDPAGDSFIFEGSYTFSSPFFVSGYYRDVDADGGNGGADALGLKLGRYFTLNDNLMLDVAGRFGNVDFGIADSNYWGIESNIRTRIDQFEIFAGLGYVDLTDGGNDNQYQFGTRFYVTDQFSVGARYQDSLFGDGLRVEASYHF